MRHFFIYRLHVCHYYDHSQRRSTTRCGTCLHSVAVSTQNVDPLLDKTNPVENSKTSMNRKKVVRQT
jgi:hypothetical protein